MTAVTYGYEPQRRDDTGGQRCYCDADATGQTRYWVRDLSKVVWQCGDHLPADAAVYEAAS